jgi:molybdopterin adenylyltransferase
MINIKSVNISEKKGTIKLPVPEISLTHYGVEGDAHSGPWNRQVSLLGTESISRFEREAGRAIRPGEFAENITTEGIELWKLKPLDRFENEHVTLEVTQIGKECHGTSCSIFKEVGNCVMPKEGIFCRVIRQGVLKPGDTLKYVPKNYHIYVITLSDRASAGEYEDKSGPRVIELLNEYFENHNPFITRHPSPITRDPSPFTPHPFLIPDNPGKLQDILVKARSESPDIIITTGGTGIGPRDITPDVVRPLLDKEIPGIMEAIRMRFGMDKPAALLSRSIAGVMGSTLVFTLPGSVKAVNEYMEEIFKSMSHMIAMLHGLDSH